MKMFAITAAVLLLAVFGFAAIYTLLIAANEERIMNKHDEWIESENKNEQDKQI